MAIQFEIDDACTVFLPEMPTVSIDPKQARQALDRDRKNALIIETLPHQKEAWQQRIKHGRRSDKLPIFYCMPAPPTKGGT